MGIRKLATQLAVLTLAIGSLVAVRPAPASAAPATFWGCPFGVACVYDGRNGTGDRKVIGVGDHPVGNCYNFSVYWDNRVESATQSFGSYGGQPLYLYLYVDQGCRGRYVPVANLAYNYSGEYANSFSSFKIRT
jgi:hypothetical protein